MPNRAGPPPNQERRVAVWEDNLTKVVNALDARAATFDALLGPSNRERWIAVALHALSGQKNLLAECTPLSIVEAIRESAAMNLSPTGLLGEGWILPYRDQAKFQPGYRGYLKLLRNSGQIKKVDAQVVYMNDDFEISLGTDPKIVHHPALFGEKDEEGQLVSDRGEYRGVYAYVVMSSGELVIEWMPWVDVEKIKRLSPSVRAGRPSPWDDHEGEMGRKTVLRRLVKRLPLESMPLVAQAVMADEAADTVEGSAVEVPEARPSVRATAAAYALGRGAPEAPPEEQRTSETEAPAAAVDAPADPEGPPPCLDPSPYGDGDFCRKAAGHPGNHQAPGGSW